MITDKPIISHCLTPFKTREPYILKKNLSPQSFHTKLPQGLLYCYCPTRLLHLVHYYLMEFVTLSHYYLMEFGALSSLSWSLMN